MSIEYFDLDKAAFFKEIGYVPHPGQLAIHNSTARYRVVATGARWGKSTCASREAMAAMLKPDSLGWICAPNYDLANIVFTAILRGWQNAKPEMIASFSESERYLKLINGSSCYAKSADNPVSLLGRGLDWVVFDECAQAPPEIWQEFLMPRLIDKRGWALFTSTPSGRNWFYWLYLRGKNGEPDHYSQTGETWENPVVNKADLLSQKENHPQKFWEQNILGGFLDDQSSVFRNVRSHISGTLQEPTPQAVYSMGCDLGKSVDYTVLTVLDVNGHVVFWEQLRQGLNWAAQKETIKSISQKYNNCMVYIDSSGLGDPILDDLVQAQVNVYGVPTAQEKVLLIDALTVGFESNRITFPKLDILIDELEAFECEKTSTGRDRYNAPQGQHDDAVISLALAWRGMNRGGGISKVLTSQIYPRTYVLPESTFEQHYNRFDKVHNFPMIN